MECSRCLITDEIKEVKFNDKGECNFCELHNRLEAQYPKGITSKLNKIISKIKRHKGKYNCLLGISGGCDSSYLLYLTVKKFGLKPLVIHFDNGWNTNIAKENIKNMVNAMNVDLITYQLNKKEYDDLNNAFLEASVSEADIPNDIAMTTLFMETAVRYGIKYVFNGHDFRTEGSAPLSWTYMDGKYIESVYYCFTGKKLQNYPLLTFGKQLWWALLGIKQIRPLYYIDYYKPKVKEFLKKEFDWQDYGLHHCENIYTAFVGCDLLPKKFGIDKRIIEYSALIRSRYMTKKLAKTKLKIEVPSYEQYINIDLDKIYNMPTRTFKEFDTYYNSFKRYKWLIWLAVKLNLLPRTFYEKYTKEI
jgi:N-acetyl sugar amidotransferase